MTFWIHDVCLCGYGENTKHRLYSKQEYIKSLAINCLYSLLPLSRLSVQCCKLTPILPSQLLWVSYTSTTENYAVTNSVYQHNFPSLLPGARDQFEIRCSGRISFPSLSIACRWPQVHIYISIDGLACQWKGAFGFTLPLWACLLSTALKRRQRRMYMPGSVQ